MKALAEFTRTTLIGGVLIVLPIYLSILLLAKSLAIVVTLLSPVTAQIPETMQFRQIIASLNPSPSALSRGSSRGPGRACVRNSRSNAICSTASPATRSFAGWPRAWRDGKRVTCSPWRSWRWGMGW